MHAVITVVGADKVGILARVATACAELSINVEEVTQTILRGTFAMIMIVSLPETFTSVDKLSEALKGVGGEMGVDINVTRRELFDSMHRI